jgi:hypothetical protein
MGRPSSQWVICKRFPIMEAIGYAFLECWWRCYTGPQDSPMVEFDVQRRRNTVRFSPWPILAAQSPPSWFWFSGVTFRISRLGWSYCFPCPFFHHQHLRVAVYNVAYLNHFCLDQAVRYGVPISRQWSIASNKFWRTTLLSVPLINL